MAECSSLGSRRFEREDNCSKYGSSSTFILSFSAQGATGTPFLSHHQCGQIQHVLMKSTGLAEEGQNLFFFGLNAGIKTRRLNNLSSPEKIHFPRQVLLFQQLISRLASFFSVFKQIINIALLQFVMTFIFLFFFFIPVNFWSKKP